MLKIENEKQLIKFLKMITENAVKDSQVILEKDPYVERFKANQNNNKEIYDLDEADENEEKQNNEEEEISQDDSEENESEDDDSEENESEDDDSEESGENGDLTPAAKKALDLPGYDSDQVPNLESLLTAINLVRAGNSLKDKKVKSELKDYFEKLDENEKSVLVLFLKELAKITTGAIDGDEGQDPGDTKSHFNITKKENEPQTNISPNQNQQNDIQMKTSKLPVSKEIEDTTPPIKVNESQDISDIKRKIKLIMEG